MARIRRSAEGAKRAILDAAERLLLEVGPSAIRLQDVAAEVGISHPAVLHHFGSREALVEAVADRALRGLQADLVARFSDASKLPDPKESLDAVFSVLGDRGHARLVAWLTLSGLSRPTKESRAYWTTVIDAVHGLRTKVVPKALREETTFVLMLSALALFGEALIGEPMFQDASVDKAGRARFRAWLGELMLRTLATP